MESPPKRRKFSLFTFEVKEIYQGLKKNYIVGFSYHQNDRVQDFLKNYIEKKGDKLFSFQLSIQKNNEDQSQINLKEGEHFIPLEYIEGIFLDEIQKIAFSTFQGIFLQLLKAIFILHQRKILARCISSKNIFINQFQGKIYLVEFGFDFLVEFDQIYKPTIDISLLIIIMKELYQKEKCDQLDNFQKLIKSIEVLEKELPKLNTLESYRRLYELVQNGPTKKDVEELYTQQWESEMDTKISNLDFQSLIAPVKGGSDDTDDEHSNRAASFLNRYDFLKLSVEMFQKRYPEEYDQIGLMWSLMSYYVKESAKGNKEEIQKQINSVKQNKLDQNLFFLIDDQIYKSQKEADFLIVYRLKTHDTYKNLLRSKSNILQSVQQDSLEDVKLSFMLVATLVINRFDENSLEFSKLYKNKNKKTIQDKTNQILEQYYQERRK